MFGGRNVNAVLSWSDGLMEKKIILCILSSDIV